MGERILSPMKKLSPILSPQKCSNIKGFRAMVKLLKVFNPIQENKKN